MVLVKPSPPPPNLIPPSPDGKAPPAEPQSPEIPPDAKAPPPVDDVPGPAGLIAVGAALAYLLVSHWGFKTIFHTVFTRPVHFFGRLFRHFMPDPAKKEREIEQAMGHYFSQVFTLNSPRIAHWLHREAVVVEHLTGTIMATAQWTFESLHILRSYTIPHLIYRATHPLETAVNKLDPSIPNATSTWDTASRYINNALRSLPWGTGTTFETTLRQEAQALAHVYNQFFDFRSNVWQPWLATQWQPLKTRVDYIWHDLYDTGRNGLESIRARLGELEAKVQPILTNPTTWILAGLGTAAGIAGFQGLMRTAEPNLTCDNTKTFTEDLCASPAGTGHNWANILGDLAALALGFEFLLDPKAVVHAAQQTEGILYTGVEWMAGLGSVALGDAEASVEAGIVDLFGL
jgi:hypothetical protein